MGRYIVRRLLQMIPVLIITTFIFFLMFYALPGDPFAGRCGQRPCSAAYIQIQTERLHLDSNVFVQYWYYATGLLQGDFGTTASGRTVADEIQRAFPITLRLAFLAICFEFVIGVAAGILSALRRGRFSDNLILVVTLILISLPVFVTGFLGQYFLGVKFGWFRVTARPDAPWGDLILPALVLSGLSMAFVVRLMRSSFLEVLSADHVRTAIAKGLPRSLVIRRHIVRNALIPVITFVAADAGVLLGGAIITEGIFNIQGIGGLVYQAIRLRESATVVGIVTVIVLIILFVNLLVDLLYAKLDPRIRYE